MVPTLHGDGNMSNSSREIICAERMCGSARESVHNGGKINQASNTNIFWHYLFSVSLKCGILPNVITNAGSPSAALTICIFRAGK